MRSIAPGPMERWKYVLSVVVPGAYPVKHSVHVLIRHLRSIHFSIKPESLVFLALIVLVGILRVYMYI